MSGGCEIIGWCLPRTENVRLASCGQLLLADISIILRHLRRRLPLRRCRLHARGRLRPNPEVDAQARAEALSFDAVEVRLDQVVCQAPDPSGNTARVECSGKILANYGAEDQEIDLSVRAYMTVLEDGAWLMCGYQ